MFEMWKVKFALDISPGWKQESYCNLGPFEAGVTLEISRNYMCEEAFLRPFFFTLVWISNNNGRKEQHICERSLSVADAVIGKTVGFWRNWRDGWKIIRFRHLIDFFFLQEPVCFILVFIHIFAITCKAMQTLLHIWQLPKKKKNIFHSIDLKHCLDSRLVFCKSNKKKRGEDFWVQWFIFNSSSFSTFIRVMADYIRLLWGQQRFKKCNQ